MNWGVIQKRWNDMMHEAKHQWGNLTDEELMSVGGNRDKLIDRICKRYCMDRRFGEREVDEWAARH